MSNQPPRPPGDEPEWPQAPGGGSSEGSQPPSAPGGGPSEGSQPPSAPGSPGGGTPPPAPPPGGTPPPGSGPPAAPPPQTGGGVAQPGGYAIGDAFTWGWQKFQQNLGPILIGALIYLIGAAIVGFVWWLIVSAVVGFGDPDTGFFALLIMTGLATLVFGALGFLVQAAITRAALGVADGRQIDVATLLSTDHIGQILLTALLVGVISGVGYLLCYLPGIIALFFLQFAMHFVIDKRMAAMDGIRASFEFVTQHVGPLIGFYLLSAVAVFVGALLCGIGMIVAVPVVVLAQVYTYRRLQGQPVAA